MWGGIREDVTSLLHTMSQSHAGQQRDMLKHHISSWSLLLPFPELNWSLVPSPGNN